MRIRKAWLVSLLLLLTTLLPGSSLGRFTPAAEQVGYALVIGACLLALPISLDRVRGDELMRILFGVWPVIFYFFLSFLVLVGVFGGEGIVSFLAYMIFSAMFVAFLPSYYLRSERRIADWAMALVLVTLLICVTSFLGTLGFTSLGPIPLFVKDTYDRIGATASAGILGQLSTFGALLVFATYCVIYLKEEGKSKVLCLTMLFVLVAFMVISQSRSAFLALFVSAVPLIVFPKLERVHALPVLSLAAALGVGPFVFLALLSELPYLSDYLRLQAGLSGRDAGWSFALAIIGQHPFVGLGPGAASALTEKFAVVLLQGGFRAEGASFHNTFITKAVEMGLFVAASYAVCFVLPSYLAVTSSAPNNLKRLVVRCALAAPVAACFSDLNIGGVRMTVFIAAVFLGLAMLLPVYYPPGRKRVRQSTSAVRPRPRRQGGALVVGAERGASGVVVDREHVMKGAGPFEGPASPSPAAG